MLPGMLCRSPAYLRTPSFHGNPHAPVHDTQLRFAACRRRYEVAVHLDASWQTIAERAAYPDTAAQLLGEATAAVALFTGHTKVAGRLSVQLRATRSPISTLFAECTATGTLRGIVPVARRCRRAHT